VKPGAGTVILMNSTNSDIMSLLRSDALIFCGGGNDVGRNNSTKALLHIMDFIKTNNHTNMISVIVPPKYDLMQSSCEQ
jgi:Ca2+-binding RTX toxin-like protein